MENQDQTIEDLLEAIFNYMNKLHRSRRTFSRYRSKWQKVKAFMQVNKITYYNTDVEKAYLTSVLGDFDYNSLNKKERELVNGIEALSGFQKTGQLRIAGMRKHPPKKFEGEIGNIIADFIVYRESTLKLSEKTIKNYIFYLYPFYSHLNTLEIRKICDIKITDILSYIEQMNPNTQALKHTALSTLRIFFRYLNEHSFLSIDYSKIIPKDNYSTQPKLPSTFTDEEIDSLLKAVDRGNPKGKRDYAILLLATKLGLRTSDICGLKFENINWEGNVITINQKKTGRILELPLLPEIGNAIINYLKHGRPVSRESHCFLQIASPYNRIQTSDLGNLVLKYISLAGINCSNRRHGPHALRHSFASALLKAKAPLPVISEALGHKGLDSSMFYLRIDITSLRKCALEVPPVSSSFYKQKGGYFYE